MHYSINPEEIKTGIENLEHTVTNVCNIKQYRTTQPLSMFLVQLKPAPNNKDIQCRIYTTVQYKIRTTQTQKRYCSMCKLSKIWEHHKLLPSQTEMCEMCRWPLDKPMPLKIKIECCPMWKSSCELQGMCGLQGPTKENIPPLRFKQYTFPAQIKQTLHWTRSNICSNNQTKFLCCHKYRARSTHKPISSANQRYTRLKKYDEKHFFLQLGTMLNLLTTVLTILT
jgi:hypothetical protein